MARFEDLVLRDTLANRPAAGTPGRVFFDTTNDILYRDNGSSWESIEGTTTPTLDLIDEQILAASAATIDFSSIPSTYRHLELFLIGRSTQAAAFTNVRLELNADSGTNYDQQQTQTNNTSVTGTATVATATPLIGWVAGASMTANVPATIRLQLFDYARTTFQKTWLAEAMLRKGTTAADMFRLDSAGNWHNTAAINQVTLTLGAASFDVGTIATLYGRN